MVKKILFFRVILIAFLVFLFISFSSFVYAGGGRIEIENLNGTGSTGKTGLYIQARIYNSSRTSMMAGEKAEFRIKSSRTGDQCTTTNITANQYGQIFGQCFTEQPGIITIYVHSLDQGDDSSEYLLTFVPSPPTATPTIVYIPTEKSTPTSKQEIMEPIKSQIVISPTPIVYPSTAPNLLIQGIATQNIPVLLLVLTLIIGIVLAAIIISNKRLNNPTPVSSSETNLEKENESKDHHNLQS